MPSKSMPSKLLDRLNLDHRRLSQVLDVIDAAAKQIETAAHGEALDHLEAALRYVAEYPDEVHHPLEAMDSLFDSIHLAARSRA